MKLVIVIIFLLILLTLNAILSSSKVKETFASGNNALPLKLFQTCGRNLAFTKNASMTNIIASERAMDDTVLAKSDPLGQCNIPSSKVNLEADSAAIIEDGIYYNLKRSCLGLAFKSFRFSNSNKTIIFTLDLSNSVNVDNFTKFLLLNPLYVEFSFGSFLSRAYTVFKPKEYYFSNALNVPFTSLSFPSGDNKTLELRFDVASDSSSQYCDTNFNYGAYADLQKALDATIMQPFTQALTARPGVSQMVNILTYYVDDRDNFQDSSMSFPIPSHVNKNRIQVFDKNFKKIYNTAGPDYKLYNFMNNIEFMYNNYISPVFTIAFDISITKDMIASDVARQGEFTLLKCFMDNNYGMTGASCANNMFAVIFRPIIANNDIYTLEITTGDGNDCGYNSQKSPSVKLQLPWLSAGVRTRIVATIAANQKHVVASWYDHLGGDNGRRLVFGSSLQCQNNAPFNACTNTKNKNEVANNMSRMFSSQPFDNGKTPRPRLENIFVDFSSYVNEIVSFDLGYINLLRKYSNIANSA